MNQKTGPKDVFLQLLSIVGLYTSVFAIGSILFTLVDLCFPDLLYDVPARYVRQGLRWPLAVLVVLFPVYVWVTSLIEREAKKFPEKRELRVRKWLIYLTLFITTLIIIGDLIALINRFLEGGITTRFVLKVLAVLLIAGGVFIYYGWILKRKEDEKHSPMRFFPKIAVGLVAIVAIGGFVAAGSPQAERIKKFDDERVMHLQTLQYEITYFWQSKERLTKNLDELRDDIGGFIPPRDPESDVPYEYRMLVPLKFELCATFGAEMNEAQYGRTKPIPAEPFSQETLFSHGIGRFCFERTIDPEIWKPFVKPVR